MAKNIVTIRDNRAIDPIGLLVRYYTISKGNHARLGRDKMTYLLRALDKDGKEFFYTGRAGEGWVSQKVSEAFTYQNLDAARTKAKRFNEMTSIHCLRFMAMVPE